MSDTRLDVARRRMAEAFSGTAVQSALVDVAQLLGALGQRPLNEALNRLTAATHANRHEQQAALIAWEDALTDHLQALLLQQANADRQQDRRIDVLDAIILGSPPPATETPPPGHDDPDEPHP